ncbi:hypothetical protein EAH79_07620 [Sphingomonas koreensis]|nr:hypothetical protein EAH79_07620 [Sphingomonas koreensis]
MLGLGGAVSTTWPALPKEGFVAGRQATEQDVEDGNAVFALRSGGKGPLHIHIPQYVLWKDEGGKEHPMILVQAEQGQGATQLVGMRDFEGKETVATLDEVKLLGTKKPK